MTPACGRCGTRAVARINGARQCLACGQESDEDGRGAADAVDYVGLELRPARDGEVSTTSYAALSRVPQSRST